MTMPAAIANRDEIAQAIIARIAGGEFVQDICAEEGMPNRSTFWEWLRADAALAAQCARARAEAAAVNEREVLLLAQRVLSTGEDAIAPEAARVAINAHTWLAKVRNPQVYGDKVSVDATVRPAQPVLNMLLVDAPKPGADVIDVMAQRIDNGGDDGSGGAGEGGS